MIHFQVYSAEKYKNCGNGSVSRTIDPKKFGFNNDLINAEKERIRKEQKEANIKFKSDSKLKQTEILTTQPEIKFFVHDDIDLQLDPHTGNSTAFVGSSKRGKTSAMMRIFNKYYNSKKDIVTLYCLNPQIELYANNPNLLIYKGFDAHAKRLIKSHYTINTRTNNKYKFTVMFDDIIDNKYDKLCNQLVLTYRNSNISSCFSQQYSKNLHPMNRANVNNVLIFGFNTDKASLEAIDDYLLGHFEKMGLHDKASRLAFFNKMVADHGFIYLKPQTGHISFHRLKLPQKK